MDRIELKNAQRSRRKLRVRKKIYGTPERPRMTVFRSNKHIYVQIVDDTAGKTLVAASNLEKELASVKNTVAEAGKIGETAGQRMKQANITKVVFDRNGYLYHGVIKAVADGARKAGIEF
ncbi:MAG: 50S ribosomal protein L18 [Spirochaetales bacterium]|jgi:large subunit ribosomal protein L18|nr:50S ribosomal protein L18 [Spirochaetales bacterium]